MPNRADDSVFIGREKEIQDFRDWVADPEAPWILHLYDALQEPTKKGGIGKTSLLKKFATLIGEQYKHSTVVSIDFFQVADRDSISVAKHVVQSLQETYPIWSPHTFAAALSEYQAAVAEERNIAESRSHVYNALTTDLQALHATLQANGSYVLLFFDTFELVEQNPAIAVLQPERTFPEKYPLERIRAVIAGRNALDWRQPNWSGRQQEVRTMSLSPFSFPEMRQYSIEQCDTYDMREQAEPTLAKLYEYTEGRPILISLAITLLNSRRVTLDEITSQPKANFEAYLVSKINELEGPISWTILFMAHIYHRFNTGFLALIMSDPDLRAYVPPISYQKLITTLRQLPFIRQSDAGEDIVLHDEMRRLINRYSWSQLDADESIRQKLSRIAIHYYENRIAQQQDEQLRQSYSVEMLFHALFVDRDDGLHSFEQHFARAIDLWQRAFARSLLSETGLFEHYLSAEQHFRVDLAEARLLRAEENYQASLQAYQRLESQRDQPWFEQYYVEIFYEQGSCYQLMNQLVEAIACFKKCLERAEVKNTPARHTEILTSLGIAHNKEGKYSEALQYYEESLNVQKGLDKLEEYASTLKSMGNVYRSLGETEEALHKCKIALRHFRVLCQEGKISELEVGLTQSTIGQIYLEREEIVEAEKAFNEAFEIYKRIEYKRGITATYNRFGEVQFAKGNLEQALHCFGTAYKENASADVETSINSLNKQGRVYATQGQREKAATFFTQAIELAKREPDYYKQAESLVDLAALQASQSELPTQALNEAETLANTYSYATLLGRIRGIYGDIYFQQQNYRSAFREYKIACRYIAPHSPLQFKRLVRKIEDRLLELPTEAVAGSIDLLTDYWVENQLDEAYPELLNICKDISKHLVF